MAATLLSQYDPLTLVSATLELLLVEDVKARPETITIYNHPDVRADLCLREGSGHFLVVGLLEVEFQEAALKAQLAPLHPGLAMVHDLCLAFPAPVQAVAHVSRWSLVNW